MSQIIPSQQAGDEHFRKENKLPPNRSSLIKDGLLIIKELRTSGPATPQARDRYAAAFVDDMEGATPGSSDTFLAMADKRVAAVLVQCPHPLFIALKLGELHASTAGQRVEVATEWNAFCDAMAGAHSSLSAMLVLLCARLLPLLLVVPHLFREVVPHLFREVVPHLPSPNPDHFAPRPCPPPPPPQSSGGTSGRRNSGRCSSGS